ncbi:hypothetical protein GUITHDRAFT_122074 [Guillardia theta CCMP2712]|uniref:EGF-like domain-containing protein n=1 Tax=Guillardia theta (strain CCMP2712) TaxID=905079 RepID=L1I638_GUITC|nr:hypothetical protein GUITHDRAFT_122074 [Guillardia theta CCMP2712]EKX31733.1 hypothetical protein GUITHDRAFT_122074 [Guillardia theta CCMP2712]|eukprot:XP_005818713.1 hypothetical protein GUITHDRAFT_122074 [Guillardia theta CCMP2712]
MAHALLAPVLLVNTIGVQIAICSAGQYSVGCGGNQAGQCYPCANLRTVKNCGASQYVSDCTTSATCVDCPANTLMVSGIADKSGCSCKPGFYQSGTNAFDCTVCAQDTYSDTVGGAACRSCPVDSSNGKQGSQTLADCKCKEGTYLQTVSSGFQCLQCIPGYFCTGGSITSCPIGTFSAITGYVTSCTSCPSGAYTVERGSTSDAQCLCNAGYVLNAAGTACVACAAGSYKELASQTSCSLCHVGKYSTVAASDDPSNCLPCPSNSNTSADGAGSLSLCKCAIGYFGSSGSAPCTECGTGTFSNSLGASACTSCSANSASLPGVLRTSASCVCNAGYSGTGTVCTACVAGTYKATVSNDNCVLCPINTYSTAVAAVSASVCTNCPAKTGVTGTSRGSLSSCQCLPNFYGTGTTCSACAGGTYSEGLGNTACLTCVTGKPACDYLSCTGTTVFVSTGVCVNCPAGSYKGTTVGSVPDCIPCPPNTTSVAGSVGIDACSCLPGFSGVITASSTVCTLCNAGQYSYAGSCIACPLGKTSVSYAQSEGDCFCTGLQYSGLDRVCRDCFPGTYSEDGISCRSCPNGFVALQGSAGCGCPANTIHGLNGVAYVSVEFQGVCARRPLRGISVASSVVIFDNGLCSVLVRWNTDMFTLSVFDVDLGLDSSDSISVSTSTGSDCLGSTLQKVITPADVGFGYQDSFYKSIGCVRIDSWMGGLQPASFTMRASVKCTPCPSGNYKLGSQVDSSSCSCAYGADTGHYATSSGVCNPCPINSYKPTRNSSEAACLPCPDGSTADSGSVRLTDCKCAAMQYLNVSLALCMRCPWGKYSSAGATSCTSDPTYQTCGVGQEGTSCTACPVGKYKGIIGSGSCTACAADSTTLLAGQHSYAACKCNAGFASISGYCLRCENGKYKDWIGDESCWDCVNGITAGKGDFCVCNPGFQGSPCVACRAGFAKADPGSFDCEICPGGSYSPVNASTSCLQCQGNFYSTAGSTYCHACPSNSVSNSSSSSPDACLCNRGYTGNAAVGCTACLPGTYKESVGSQACETCAEGNEGPLASVTRFHCVCAPGYTRDAEGYCKPCRVGTWKAKKGDSQCSACPLSTTTWQEGTTARESCVCMPGFYTVGPALCALCNENYYNDQYNASICQKCPMFSTSIQGSARIEDCICFRGFTLKNGDCTACQAGSYKNTLGSSPCVNCPANSISLPANPDSLKCFCPVGYTGNNGAVCTPCDFNTYKDVNFSTACKPCPPDSVTVSRGSTSVSDCVCKMGHYRLQDSCVACPHGKYKGVIGDQACTPCPLFQTTAKTGMLYAESCYCNAGYSGLEGVGCSACPAGSYHSGEALMAIGDVSSIARFKSGDSVSSLLYAIRTLDAVVLLTVAIPASINAGFQVLQIGSTSQQLWVGVVWSSSPVFRVRAGDGSVSVVSGNAYPGLAYADVPLASLPRGQWEMIIHVTVTPGKVEVWSNRQWLAAGKTSDGLPLKDFLWADSTSSTFGSAYTASDLFLYSGLSATSNVLGQVCRACGNGSYSVGLATSVTDCICPAGYSGGAGLDCNMCLAGKYLRASGDSSCQDCPKDSNSPVASTAISQCVCNDGFIGTGETQCTACGIAKFKSSATVCTDCPMFSSSPYASNSIESCLCFAGYIVNASHECTPCKGNQYRLTSTSCASCPEHSASLPASNSIEDCICNAGYVRIGQTCVACLAGQYESNGVCLPCPTKSTSAIASSAKTDCKCRLGYTGADGSDCVACQEGKYKDSQGSAACKECYGGASSPFASVSAFDCFCEAGFEGSADGKCQACSPGKFKPSDGNQACTSCPADTTSYYYGSKTELDCMCVDGMVGQPGGPCQPCNQSTYKITYLTCQPCGLGYYAPVKSNAISDCVCDVGYGNELGTCNMCPVGKFKDFTGDLPCTPCGDTTSTIQEGSVSSTDCVCDVGYYLDGICKACPEGKYKNFTGSGNCLACFDKATSRPASTSINDCICQDGYEQFGWQCVVCPPNYDFNNATKTCDACVGFRRTVQNGVVTEFCTCPAGFSDASSSSCLACAADSFRPFSQSNLCLGCPLHSTTNGIEGSPSSLSCACNMGYTGPDGGNCSACAESTYKNVTGNATCDQCPVHSYSPSSSESRYDCECMPGYTGVNGFDCTACTNNTFKSAYGAGQCFSCGDHSVGPSSSTSKSSCSCDVGYTPKDSYCAPCDFNYFKSTVGNVLCTKCPSDTVTTTVASETSEDCVCVGGLYLNASGQCQGCREGFYLNPTNAFCLECPQNMTSSRDSQSYAACRCLKGYYGSVGGYCTACPEGKYKDYEGPGQCYDCLGTETSALGSTSSSDCVCNPGYTSMLGICMQCSSNTFKSGIGDFACTQCPGNSASPSGSVDGSQCVCNSGYEGGYPSGCQACNSGYYNDDGRVACKPCPPNTQSALHSTRLTDCVCLPGYYGSNGVECVGCAAGKYKALAGDSPCLDCPAFSNSSALSTARTACSCNPGSYGPAGGPCTSCQAGKFSSTQGSTVCTACATNADSPANSTQITDCTCNRGYVGSAGGPCTACGIGYYEEAGVCKSCPMPGITLQTASTLSSQCLCNAGYYGTTACLACSAGSYKTAVGIRDTTDLLQLPGTTVTMSSNPSNAGRAIDGSAATCATTSVELDPTFTATLPGPFLISELVITSGANTANVEVTVGNSTIIATNAICSSYNTLSGTSSVPCSATGSILTIQAVAAADSLSLCEVHAYGSCTTCPPHTVTLATASSSLSACVCDKGYTGSGGWSCNACISGKYKDTTGSAACSPCIANSENGEAEVSSGSCLCKPGFELRSGACTACNASAYKDFTGNGGCLLCPANTVSTGSRDDISLCVCKAGYSGVDGAACNACPAGSYKSGTGSGACQQCPENTYQPALAATALSSCSSCPLNSNSSAGSTVKSSCVCLPGFQPGGDYCQQCPAGKFKSTLLMEPCSECPENTFLPSTASTSVLQCQQCPGNAISPSASPVSDSCECIKGYRNDSRLFLCLACDIGTYKDSVSNTACSPCPIHGSTAAEGSVSFSQCSCNAGYQLSGSSCLDVNECTAYSSACMLNADCQNTEGSYTCTCRVGWQLSGSACVDIDECSLGSDSCDLATTTCRNTLGSFQCDCDAGYTVGPSVSSCVNIDECLNASSVCQNNSACFDTIGSFYCVCNPGFSTEPSGLCLNIDECLLDPAPCDPMATCTDTQGSFTCTCPVGYRLSSSNLCVDLNECLAVNNCSIDATCTNTIGSYECACNEGFRGPGTYCECAICVDCVAGSYCYNGSVYVCPPHSSSPTNAMTDYFCDCFAGYYATSFFPKVCEICPPDHYCNNQQMYDCPTGSFSVAGQGSKYGCMCKPGNYFVNDSVFCYECPYDFFCGGGYTEKQPCPNGTYSKMGISKVSECACKPGTYLLPNGECYPCPENYYCAGSLDPAVRCPDHTFAYNLSSSLINCICEVGYSGPRSENCSACIPGTYKPTRSMLQCSRCPANTYQPRYAQVSVESCLQCPEFSQSANGTGSIGGCLCIPGYYRVGDACVACPAGYYTSSYNRTYCQPCGNNQYSLIVASSSSSNCISCTANSTRLSLSQAVCECNAGFEPFYGASTFGCSSCALGRYKPSLGNVSCLSCPSNTFGSAVGSTACSSCPANSVSPGGSVALEDCLCIQGYERVYSGGAFTCKQCWPGTYKDGLTGPCLECPANTYLSGYGSVSVLNCSSCPLHAVSGNRSISIGNCSCTPGFHVGGAGYPFECIGCVPGSFSIGYNLTRCDLCPVATFSPVPLASDSKVCQACPQNSTSKDGSGSQYDCHCMQGFHGRNGTACQPCPVGTYKIPEGDFPCTFCSDGTYSTVLASPSPTVCTDCPEHSTSFQPSLAYVSSCVCVPGYTGGSGACSACPIGTYKATYGADYCSLCPNNTYSEAVAANASATCLDCRSNSISPAGTGNRMGCECVKGFAYVPVWDECKGCFPGTYKSEVSNRACVICPNSTYNPDHASQQLSDCRACRNFSFAPAGSISSANCSCLLAYADVAGTCVFCLPGYVARTSGCELCPAGSIGDDSRLNCIACQPGKFSSNRSTACYDCAVGSYQQLSNQTFCSACRAGSYSAAIGANSSVTCRNCSAGYHSPFAGSSVCQQCPGGYASTVGSAECVPCAPGTVSLPGSGVCDDCEAGRYQPEPAKTSCLTCGTGRYQDSLAGTSCIACDPGKFSDQTGAGTASACQNCSDGEFNPYHNASVCGVCLPGSASPAGSTFCRDCLPGFFAESYFYHCLPCGAGYYNTIERASACLGCGYGRYQPLLGQTFCDLCPPGTFSVANGSDSILSCENCSAGYYGWGYGLSTCGMCKGGFYSHPGATNCTRCSPGSVSGDGFGFCVTCPRQTYSDASQTTCLRCASGYYSYEGSTSCLQCDHGTFLNTTGYHCDVCPNNTYSDPLKVVCLNCPEGAVSNARSSDVMQCRCPDGFEVAFVGGVWVCRACLQGSYRHGDMLSCAPCAAGYYAPETNMSSCQACEPGYYQDATGGFFCIPCDYVTYQPTYAANSSASCLSCPNHSTAYTLANPSILDCQCLAGYGAVITGNDSLVCEPCKLGTSKADSFNTPCEACKAGEYAGELASLYCKTCTTGTFSINPGQSSCASCPIGKFSSDLTMILSGCYECPPGKTTLVTGSQSISACQCLAGHEPNGATCSACLPGYYKPGINNFACIACDAGTYQPSLGAASIGDCRPCPSGSNSPFASTDISNCICKAGYGYVRAVECAACPPGYSKPYLSNSPCSPCPVGYFQPSEASVGCLSCVTVGLYTSTNSSAADTWDRCQCIDSYGLIAKDAVALTKVCRLCPVLSFKKGLSDSPCLNCSASDSIAKTYRVSNYGCEINCDAGYILDTAFDSCEPAAGVVLPGIDDVSFRKVSVDHLHERVSGQILVQHDECDVCCMEYIRGLRWNPSLLPSSLLQVNSTCGSINCSCRTSDYVLYRIPDCQICNCDEWTKNLFEAALPFYYDSYSFMQLSGDPAEYMNFTLDLQALGDMPNCTAWGQTTLNCSFYIAVTFLKQDQVSDIRFETVFHRFSYSRSVSATVSVMQKWTSDSIDYLSMDVFSFPGTPVRALKLFFHGPTTMLLRGQALTFLLSLQASNVTGYLPVCPSLAAIPTCWLGSPWLQDSVILDKWSVGAHCEALFQWLAGSYAWIFLETPSVGFDAIRLSMLLSDESRRYTYTGVVTAGREGFTGACHDTLQAFDKRNLSASVREGLNGTWRDYSEGMELWSASDQQASLVLALHHPGITEIEIVMIHAVGSLVKDLLDNLVVQGRVFQTQDNSHWVFTDAFQQICFGDFPQNCITRTSTVGMLDILHLPDDEALCEAQASAWGVKNLLMPAQVGSTLCAGRDVQTTSYFLVSTAYPWPSAFRDWIESNGQVFSYVYVAVPSRQRAFWMEPGW